MESPDMVAEIEAAFLPDKFGTHWEKCYSVHKECAIARLIAEVRALRQRTVADEWISTSTRLPDPGKYWQVMVLAHIGGKVEPSLYSPRSTLTWTDLEGWSVDTPEYWMPLPQPPNNESKGALT